MLSNGYYPAHKIKEYKEIYVQIIKPYLVSNNYTNNYCDKCNTTNIDVNIYFITDGTCNICNKYTKVCNPYLYQKVSSLRLDIVTFYYANPIII